jgi:hypothetical protein
MRKRDLIHVEFEKQKERLGERSGELMEKLLKIRIDGPEDWSET